MTTFTAAYTLRRPQVVGPLAVFPVFGPQPKLAYRSLSAAIGQGVIVKEVDGGADVRQVIIDNKSEMPILVYEGEQISGAQQNRAFDSSVLVPARSSIPVPVSCIERGRWDHSRNVEHFTVSPHAADPAMRAIRREQANEPEGTGRPDQDLVWSEVDARLSAFEVASSTDSLEDLFAAQADRLEEIKPAVLPVPGQLGALVEISGRPVALDLVSRPEVFTQLAPGLTSGYALQAVKARPGHPDDEKAQRFLAKALETGREELPNYGLGHAFAISRKRVVGAGLEYDGETIALSVFRRL